MKTVIHHPLACAVARLYSRHLETHLLLGSTRFPLCDEKGSSCRWALGHHSETLLLQRTEPGSSHMSWDTHLKRAARVRRWEHVWHSLLTSTSWISSAGETTALGGPFPCFCFSPLLHTSKSSLPMGCSSMAISRYTNTCCLKHKDNCSEGKASCLCCARFLTQAWVQPLSTNGLRKCLWDSQLTTAFLLFCVNTKVEHVSLCSGQK